MRLITKHNAMSNAFTLAEVLITLAIIGVVAAMTMPTLINNTNGAQFKTAYKKALSVLSQAVVMNIALDDYDLAGTSAYAATDGDIASDDKEKSIDEFPSSLYKLFKARTNGTPLTGGELDDYKVQIKNDGTDPSQETAQSAIGTEGSNFVFRFQDGIIFSFDGEQQNCTEAEPCKGWIDANGTKGPNRSVSCPNSGGECTDIVKINDIFPIKFYDQTVAPASPAARAVLYGSENNPTGEESED